MWEHLERQHPDAPTVHRLQTAEDCTPLANSTIFLVSTLMFPLSKPETLNPKLYTPCKQQKTAHPLQTAEDCTPLANSTIVLVSTLMFPLSKPETLNPKLYTACKQQKTVHPLFTAELFFGVSIPLLGFRV